MLNQGPVTLGFYKLPQLIGDRNRAVASTGTTNPDHQLHLAFVDILGIKINKTVEFRNFVVTGHCT